jgi:unsaturated rhamnogalacturonyl hydrolase
MASDIVVPELTRSSDLGDVLKRVRAHTAAWRQEPDHWERSPALNGLLAWGGEQDVAAARSWLDRAVETQTTAGDLAMGGPIILRAGHVSSFVSTGVLPSSFGYPLLSLYELTDEPRYLEAAKRQMASMMASPRTSDGGLWGRAEAPELWIDMTYMICAFLVRFGQLTDSPQYIDEGFSQWEIHYKHLVDPHVHLGRHTWCETPNSYPQSTLWSRGNGWLVCAAVDILELCPDHERAPAVREKAGLVIKALARHQDESGLLRNILDDPTTPFETSGTLMFAYAAAKAARQGFGDDEYIERATRAVRVAAGSVDDAGAVMGVAIPPGGPGVPFASAAYGQGFFLLACDVLRDELGLSAVV